MVPPAKRRPSDYCARFQGLLSASQYYSLYRFENERFPLWRLMMWQMPNWYMWGLLAPLILRLGKGREAGELFRDRTASVELERDDQPRADHETRIEVGPDDASAMHAGGDQVQRLSPKLLYEEEVAEGIGQGDHRHGPQVSGDHLQDAEEQLGLCGLPQFCPRRRLKLNFGVDNSS
jgi:hypothetical protein